MHESRSKLALRRQRDKNGRYIPLPEAEEQRKNKVKCTRGRKSQQYYELMRKYEEEGNFEMIEQLKIHGTKKTNKKKDVIVQQSKTSCTEKLDSKSE